MLRPILLSLSVVLLAGCGSAEKKEPMPHKKMMMQHTMFQSVSKEKAILVQKGKEREHCHICGMYLPKFYKTNYAATENGVEHQYCSIHCLEDDLRHGVKLKNIQVVDAKSLKFIPAKRAYYVVGSKIHGTMSRVSKYAFKSLDDAKAFKKKYGGKIVDFATALDIAKKDFK